MLNELMYLFETDKTNELFPGLSSSAFDEHRTNKQTPPNVDKIKRQILQLEILTRAAESNGHKIRKMFQATGRRQGRVDTRISDMPWIDKYPLTRQDIPYVRVDIDSPAYNKLERFVASYETTLDQQERYSKSVKRLKSKMLRVRKQEAERNIKDKAATIPKANVDINTMPHTFNVKYRTEKWATPKQESFHNPNFFGEIGKTAFAGHPAHYTEWKGKLRTMFYELEKWVKDLGHPPLDMMYASTPKKAISANEFPRYYLTNSDGSVIIVNDDYNKIYIHAKAPNLPADSLPIRWRMRQLRAKDFDWLAGKLKLIKK